MRPIYSRDGLECLLDRSRGFLVNQTPEEHVRQDELDWLIDDLKIPPSLVRSEFNTRSRGGRGRADIIVLAPGSTDHQGDALLVVECKRPDAFLDDKARDQALEYASDLGATYVVLTNGAERVPFARARKRWAKLDQVPTWREMKRKQGLRWSVAPERVRESWTTISTPAKYRRLLKEGGALDDVIGEDSSPNVIPFALNLLGCLAFEDEALIPIEDDKLIIVKDLGTRSRWFGNAAGGTWPSERYRSFLVRNKATGFHQVVSLTVLAGAKQTNHPSFGNRRGLTYLLVAIDDGAASHQSLELALDLFMSASTAEADHVMITHNGRLTAGKRGAVKRDVVIEHLARGAPYLVRDGLVQLGSLPSNRLITWTDARDFLMRTVRYGLERDELRRKLRGASTEVSA